MDGQRHAPAALPLQCPFLYQMGGPQGRSGWVGKIFVLTGIRSPDRLDRNDYAIRAHLCESVDKQNHSQLRPVATCLTATRSRLFACYFGLDVCSLQRLTAPKYIPALRL